MAKVIELQNSAGTKVGQLDERECSATVSRGVNEGWTISIVYPVPVAAEAEDKSSLLGQFCRARVYDIGSADYSTFVLTRPRTSRDESGRITVVSNGHHLAIKNLNSVVISATHDYTGSTPTAILTMILGYVSGWSVGTVAPTAKVNVYISYETAMSALQKLLSACGGEYDVDEANSEIDIVASLGSDNSVQIRPERNMESVTRTYFSRDVINKMYGVGRGQPPVTIAGARHVVSGYVSGTGVLTCLGNKVVTESDSWNTSYKVRFKTGAEAGNVFTISDCAAGASQDTLTIDTAQTIVAGDKFAIEDASGNEVDFVLAGSSITSYGSIEGVYQNSLYANVINLVETPALDGTYAAGLCPDWTEEGSPGTKEENTTADYMQYGGASQKIIGAADADGVSQEVGVTSGKYYTLLVWVYIAAGTVKVEWDDGTNIFDLSKSATGWQRFEIQERAGGATITVSVLQDGASAATFYLDGAMLTEGILSYSFSSNCDQKALWDETYDALMDVKDPPLEYQVSFVDLYRMSPEEYGSDEISIGDTVTIYDSEIGITDVSARVKRIDYDVFRPELTRHTISNL